MAERFTFHGRGLVYSPGQLLFASQLALGCKSPNHMALMQVIFSHSSSNEPKSEVSSSSPQHSEELELETPSRLRPHCALPGT